MSSSARLQFVRPDTLELLFETDPIAPTPETDASPGIPPLLALGRVGDVPSVQDRQGDGHQHLPAKLDVDLRRRVEVAEMKTRLAETKLRALIARLELDALKNT